MRKLLYNIAIGSKYADIERITGPYRRLWAEKWGWEYRPVTEVPDSLFENHGARGVLFALDLFKLYHASNLLEYDLVAYSDTDTFWNPGAPDLTEYADQIPEGGFAGVRVVSPEARSLFLEWEGDYYVELEQLLGQPLDVPDRDLHFNGGLVLHKPRQVAERWLELAKDRSALWDEQRLCLYEAQRGKLLLLPSEWNVVWRYHVREHYPYLDWRKNRRPGIDHLNYVLERSVVRRAERMHLLHTLSRVNMLHLANEFWKVHLLNGVDPGSISQYSNLVLKPRRFYL